MFEVTGDDIAAPSDVDLRALINLLTVTTVITLTRTEAGLRQAAAVDDGRLTPTATLKPSTHARLLGRLPRDGLMSAPIEPDGPHRLTAAGYRAVGLTPPKSPRITKAGAGASADAAGTAAPRKKAQMPELLRREQADSTATPRAVDAAVGASAA